MANPTMKVSGLNHGNSYPVKDHLDTNVMLTDNVALYQRHLGLVSLADYLSSVIYPDDSFENFFRLKLNSTLDDKEITEEMKHQTSIPKLKLSQFDDLWFLGDDQESTSEAGADDYLASIRKVISKLENSVSGAVFPSIAELSEKCNFLGKICLCKTCKTTITTNNQEVKKFGIGWVKLRWCIETVYSAVCEKGSAAKKLQGVDLVELREIVSKLVEKKPFLFTLKLQETLGKAAKYVKDHLLNKSKEGSKSTKFVKDLISAVVDNYNRLRKAWTALAPIFVDLENEYLKKFSLTWDAINKAMFYRVVACDPTLNGNIRNCGSQLIKSSRNKPAISNGLVQTFLDFALEMTNTGLLWKSTGPALFQSQIDEAIRSIRESPHKTESDFFYTLSGEEGLLRIKRTRERFLVLVKRDLLQAMDLEFLFSHMEMIAMMRQDVPDYVLDAYKKRAKNLPLLEADESLSSIMAALGLTSPTVSETEELDEKTTDDEQSDTSPKDDYPDPLSPSPDTAAEDHAESKEEMSQLSKSSSSGSSCTEEKSASPVPNSETSTSAKPKTKKSSTDIKQLLQQHYCSAKTKKKHKIPSAGAIRRGKVPPPPTCILGDEDSTDELSEDSSSIAIDDTGSSGSSMASHNSNGSKQCSCCYCEFLDHNPNGSTIQYGAPVSRNYTAMRERLRLILNNKKKIKQASQATQAVQPQAQQPSQLVSTNLVQESAPKQENSVSQTISRQVPHMGTKSLTSAHNSGLETKTKQGQESASNSSLEGHDDKLITTVNNPKSKERDLNDHTYSLSLNPLDKDRGILIESTGINSLPQNQETSKAKAPREPTPCPNAQKRSQSATALAPSNVSSPELFRLEKSQSAVASQSDRNPEGLSQLNDVNQLVDFIEGNGGITNEKRRAKKERQKLQRIEIIKTNETEIQMKKEAVEAARKRKEEKKAAQQAERRRREEERAAQEELERVSKKKKKKIAAQKERKSRKKGNEEPEKEPHQTEKDDLGHPTLDTDDTIEELLARQEQELHELITKHQKQLEEEKKLKEFSQVKAMSKDNKKGCNAVNSSTPKSAQQQGANQPQKKEPPKKLPPQKRSKKQSKQQVPTSEPTPTQRHKDGVDITQMYEPGSRQSIDEGNFSSSSSEASCSPPQSLSQQSADSMFDQQKPFEPINSLDLTLASTNDVESNQPFETVKQGRHPTAFNETVNISSYDKENNRFYIPVNGKTNGAESASLAKKLSAQDHIWPTSFNKVNNNQSQRPPLPMDIRRNLDLDRLKLLPGISVTKIQGPVPDRKYFPQNIQSTSPLNGSVRNQPSSILTQGSYTATDVGPNGILVEAANLPMREEKRLQRGQQNAGDHFDCKTTGFNPVVGANSYKSPKFQYNNGYQNPSGLQYLMKSVNENVSFTPLHGRTETADAANNCNNCGYSRITTGTISPRYEAPGATKLESFLGEAFDDIDSIFEPRDIDLEEIDEDEREIEAFKRFCHDSVSLRQKTKVNINLKNLILMKKH